MSSLAAAAVLKARDPVTVPPTLKLDLKDRHSTARKARTLINNVIFARFIEPSHTKSSGVKRQFNGFHDVATDIVPQPEGADQRFSTAFLRVGR